MQYQSSRGNYSAINAADAIKMGISPDGGLFVPDTIPQLSENDMEAMEKMSYQERAVKILSLFLTDFTSQEIKDCVYQAYNKKSFDHEKVAPLTELQKDVFVMELWHGPTCAFKDMALQILPRLMSTSMRKTGEDSEIVILVATSGDTGKAALQGFSGVDGTRIIVFFPDKGVSEIQKRQMLTQEGDNVYVSAVKGNFDDAQSGVKSIFADQEFAEILAKQRLKLSSANSINWGRLVPQIVYYISAYIDLRVQGKIKAGETFNIVVPTGNFGNILAAYYAAQMGVPVNRLICAANTNNVLSDFIKTGEYNRNRSFARTISPSMDILISSNLERLLYEITDHDAGRVKVWMEQLKDSGRYDVGAEIHAKIKKWLWSDYCSDAETLKTIGDIWEEQGYLLDTHTAVAVDVYKRYVKETNDQRVTVIAATASPFKFGSSVAGAVLSPEQAKDKNEFALLHLLEEKTGIKMPTGIKNLEQKEIRHKTVCEVGEMKETVAAFLGLNN